MNAGFGLRAVFGFSAFFAAGFFTAAFFATGFAAAFFSTGFLSAGLAATFLAAGFAAAFFAAGFFTADLAAGFLAVAIFKPPSQECWENASFHAPLIVVRFLQLRKCFLSVFTPFRILPATRSP
jgi:hypothetical protein